MTRIIDQLSLYLRETLNTTVRAEPWKEGSTPPLFLSDFYDFYKMELFDEACLLMTAKEKKESPTPGIIRKHWEQVKKNWEGPLIYVQSTLSAYDRKRLIEHHLPFIIPGNQMYLPYIGIDLREHFRKTRQQKREGLSPASQAVVIEALCHEIDEKLTPTAFAKRLDYTLMTMTRAFDELQALRIGEFHREGRERCWIFANKPSLWEQAKPFLCSPVKKRLWIKDRKFKILAGLSALSHFSQLAPPRLPIFAISHPQWKSLQQKGIEILPSPDEASLELEIWQYPPDFFSQDGVVDPFSLFLSLDAEGDERIEAAIEEMMENIRW